MFELIDGLHQVEHVGAIVGLSAGGLALCAGGAWFLVSARPFAIAVAATIVCSASAGIYEHHVGRDEVLADWTAANAAEAEQQKARDAAVEKGLEAKYAPLIAANQQQAKSNDKAILADISAASTGPCQLGAAALRLRPRSK